VFGPIGGLKAFLAKDKVGGHSLGRFLKVPYSKGVLAPPLFLIDSISFGLWLPKFLWHLPSLAPRSLVLGSTPKNPFFGEKLGWEGRVHQINPRSGKGRPLRFYNPKPEKGGLG